MREPVMQNWPAKVVSCREQRHDGVEVGVVEDDHRRLATQLEDIRLSSGAPPATIIRPTAVLPV